MSDLTRLPRSSLFLVPALVAALIAGGSVVYAATTAKSGKAVTAVRTVTADQFAETSSFTYSDLTGMSTTISVPSSQKALLIVTFSADSSCVTSTVPRPDTQCFLRVLVDGAPAAPGEVIFDSAPDGDPSNLDPSYIRETNAMQFVAGPVNAGSHTIKVQWRTDDMLIDFSGGHFYVWGRTLTVLRARV
jgi:hypothetical protein